MKKAVLSVLVIGLFWVGCSKPADSPEETAGANEPVQVVEPEGVEPEPVLDSPETVVAAAVPVPEPVPAPETVKPPVAEPPAPAAVPAPTRPEPPTTSVPRINMTPDSGKRLLELTSKVVGADSVQSDPVLKEISHELGRLVQNLGASAASDLTLNGILQESLESLLAGNDAAALASYKKLAAARLSGPQSEMAARAGNTVSAFVAQRNFSGLTSAQREVSRLVNALRYGDMKMTLDAAKGVTGNAELSASQEAVLNAIAERAAKSQQN